ncbi:MAG TPA: hypothetical protein VK797_10390 [Tepidisphaeraceae bacterium]|jgi:hypothetical protein|nr:hypothetical protein [Tepidisphaeraceae bacterium]
MIVRVDPESWDQNKLVQLDSDAPDNKTAIREMEDWAAEHGFARTNEYWLRRALTPNGKRVFRGICFRLMPDEIAAANSEGNEIEQRMKRMPVLLTEEPFR